MGLAYVEGRVQAPIAGSAGDVYAFLSTQEPSTRCSDVRTGRRCV
jgi:hypothetical protein